jgi:hypothetical protein
MLKQNPTRQNLTHHPQVPTQRIEIPMTLGDTNPSFSDLDQLLSIITTGVQDIKRSYTAADQPFPNFQKPYAPNAAAQSTQVMTQTALVVAAASQLIRTLRSPAQTVIEETLSVS